MSGLAAELGSRMVAGSVLTNIRVRGEPAGVEQRPPPAQSVELHQQVVLLGGAEERVGRLQAGARRPRESASKPSTARDPPGP